MLEVETGITKNEPVQLAIQNAIENAVESLIIEGIEDKLWSTADGKESNDAIVAQYNARKEEDENTLLYNRKQAQSILRHSFAISGNGPVLNADYSKKSLGGGGGLKYSYYLSPKLDIGLKGDYHYFTGGQNFYKSYLSSNLQLGYTILPLDKLTPYVYGGIGGIFDMDKPEEPLSEDTSGINLQYGLALKYNFNPRLSLTVGAENNHTTSDAIDNVVNGVRDDFYYNFHVGLEWRFGKNLK